MRLHDFERQTLSQARPKTGSSSVWTPSGTSVGHKKSPAEPPDPLAPREREILGYLAEGLSNADIGRRLHLSAGSIKAHLRELYARFGVKDRVSLVVAAIDAGLLSREAREQAP